MTPQDMETFRTYAKSEIVRLMRLRVYEWRDIVQAQLLSVPPSHLQLIQGELRGLNAAIKMMDPDFVAVASGEEAAKEEYAQPTRAKPMISNHERLKLKEQAPE